LKHSCERERIDAAYTKLYTGKHGRTTTMNKSHTHVRASLRVKWALSLFIMAVIAVIMLVMAASSTGKAGAAAPPGPQAGGVGPGSNLQSNPLGAVTSTPTSTPCGPAWVVVKSPNVDATHNYLLGVAVVGASDVWAVGAHYDFDTARNQTLVEHWDGASWSVVPSANANTGSNQLNDIAVVSANDVWAVGSYDTGNFTYQTLVEHWNGTSWSVVSSPNAGTISNQLAGVAAVSTNDVWAVGYSYNGSADQTLIEHWNGTSWSVVASPSPGTSSQLDGVAVVSANDVWAVGYRDNGGIGETLIERWDGASWSVVPSPNVGTSGNQLVGVAAISANDVWAVGSYNTGASNFVYQTLIEHWDGTSWSVVASPNPNPYNNYLKGVAVVSANDVWAVGDYLNGAVGNNPNGDISGTIIEHWDGTAWSVVPSPSPGQSDQLNGVAVVGASDVWAVGYYDSGSLNRTLVERYTPYCAPPTATPTSTPTPMGVIIGHVIWQGIPQPDIRNEDVFAALSVCAGGVSLSYGVTTDASGFFTVTTGLEDGSYNWWIKGDINLANAGNLVIVDRIVHVEMGTLAAGDCTNDNAVTVLDFNVTKITFGKSPGEPGYDARSDFNRDNIVNILDFNAVKINFGHGGAALTCP
jgi:hypothetical protein